MQSRIALSACLAVVVSGCGGVADDLTAAKPEPRVVRRVPPPTSPGPNESDGDFAEVNDEDGAARQPSGEDVSPEGGDMELDGLSHTDGLLRDLAVTCGGCHGDEAIANDAVQGGFACVEDINCSVRLGIIIPLRSSESPLIQVMRDQSMPPRGVQPRPDNSLISAFALLIDNPLFWPEP